MFVVGVVFSIAPLQGLVYYVMGYPGRCPGLSPLAPLRPVNFLPRRSNMASPRDLNPDITKP